MPLLITEMELSDIEILSLVDKGASGDKDTRPEIVLFKRDKKKMLEKVIDAVKAAFAVETRQMEEKEMPVSEKLAELGLSEEQMAAVLQIIEQLAKPPAPAEQPVAMQEEAAPVGKQEDEEEKPMDKRDAEHKAELMKRDAENIELLKRVKALEEQAEMIEIEKRADELKWLPQSREETVEILKAAKGDKKILALLEKTNEAMKTSPVLRVCGAVGDTDNDVKVQIQKRAEEILKENPGMDPAAARGKAMAENPDLFVQARSGQ